MGMEDVRSAFKNASHGLLTLKESGLGYRDNKQYLTFTGWQTDGTPFAFVSAPFTGDPNQRAQEIAADLIRTHTGKPITPIPMIVEPKPMPAPQPITSLASVLRQSLQGATARAQKLAGDVQDSVAHLNEQLDMAEKTKAEIDAASADIQQALGMSNGGPPLSNSSGS